MNNKTFYVVDINNILNTYYLQLIYKKFILLLYINLKKLSQLNEQKLLLKT